LAVAQKFLLKSSRALARGVLLTPRLNCWTPVNDGN
jgi:hypothetical protein